MLVDMPPLEGVGMVGDRLSHIDVGMVGSAFGEVVVQGRSQRGHKEYAEGNSGHNLDGHFPQRRQPGPGGTGVIPVIGESRAPHKPSPSNG